MSEIVTLTVNPAIDISTSLERIAPERKLRCERPRRDPGGGGINVARVVRRLGGAVTAIYLEGGETGRLLRRLVDAEGIPSLTIRVAEETRFDFHVVEEDTEQHYRFVLPGPHLTEDEWQGCLDALDTFCEEATYVVASGSLAPGVPADFYARAARIAKARNARFVLDTSGAPLEAALAEGVYLVKPNLREIRELVGGKLKEEEEIAAACRKIVESGRSEIVTVTLGQRGALLVSRDVILRADAIPVVEQSAVGAGDSFLGALVWRLAGGGEIEDAFRYGIAAGSAALITPGTELIRREDVDRLCPKVSIKALSGAIASGAKVLPPDR